ncbi:MAG: pilus assembly protein [Dactylosporangium sp.]|nr:pilus assembly protein [Dactylosporangium sp.]NNJ59355.1 pilus assembly protein [Dactylosporangium sp.]
MNCPARWSRAVVARLRRISATGDAGSATAELTLITPLLVMFLLLVVLCGRLVSAQLDLDAAASAGARAASLARTDHAAQAAAEHAAMGTLVARGVTCQNASVTLTGTLTPGGAVTVRVTCRVPLDDLVLLDLPGSRRVEGEATSPIDQWRGTVPP